MTLEPIDRLLRNNINTVLTHCFDQPNAPVPATPNAPAQGVIRTVRQRRTRVVPYVNPRRSERLMKRKI